MNNLAEPTGRRLKLAFNLAKFGEGVIVIACAVCQFPDSSHNFIKGVRDRTEGVAVEGHQQCPVVGVGPASLRDLAAVVPNSSSAGRRPRYRRNRSSFP